MTNDSVYPARYKLPVKYATEIGRIITRWAFLEWRLHAIAYQLLKIGPKEGRIAVREPRIDAYITMIEDLMYIKKATTSLNLKDFKKALIKHGETRNLLAHGVWVLHENTKTPVVQLLSGTYPPAPGKQAIKAKIDPQALTVSLQFLRNTTHNIEEFIKVIEHLRGEISAQLEPLP